MTDIREAAETMAAFFRDHGLNARAAWQSGRWTAEKKPEMTVELARLEGGPAGLQDYLGERWNSEKNIWEEVYGRKASAEFELNFYAMSASECMKQLETTTVALQAGRPGGWTVKRLSCEETEFDRERGRYVRKAAMECEGFLTAATEESGAFLDFEVRGERTR